MRHLAFAFLVAVATLCGAGQYEVRIDPPNGGTAEIYLVETFDSVSYYSVRLNANEHFTANNATWVQMWDDQLGHHEKAGATNLHPNNFSVGSDGGTTYSAKDIVAHFTEDPKFSVTFKTGATDDRGVTTPGKRIIRGYEGDEYSVSITAKAKSFMMFTGWRGSGVMIGDASAWSTYARGDIPFGDGRASAGASFERRHSSYPPTGPHSTQKHYGSGDDPPDDERAYIVVTVSGDLPEYFASVSKSPSEDCYYGRPGETGDVTLDATMANNRCLFVGWHGGTGSRIAATKSASVSLTYPEAGETLYVHYTAEGYSNGTKRVVCFTQPEGVGATIAGDGIYSADASEFTVTETTDETDRYRFLYWEDLDSDSRFTRLQKSITESFDGSLKRLRAVFHEYTHLPMFDKDSGEIVHTEGSVTGDFGNAN